MLRSFSNEQITILFRISLVIKVAQGLLETILGFVFLFIHTSMITFFIQELTRDELIENPYSRTSLFLIHAGNSIITSGTMFIAFYLLSHGILKLILIIGVIKKKLLAYYAFILILIGFIIYQWHRYILGHSTLVLIFTLFDMLFAYLAWKESQIVRNQLQGVPKV